MKLSKELTEELKEAIRKQLPDYDSDCDVNDNEISIDGIAITVTDSVFIDLSEESE